MRDIMRSLVSLQEFYKLANIHQIRSLKPKRSPILEGEARSTQSRHRAILRKRGVKPEHLETLTRQVIIQAEAMFKEWPLVGRLRPVLLLLLEGTGD
jgi:hypothetical protein